MINIRIENRELVKGIVDAGFVPMPLIYAEYGKNHEFEVRKWGEIKTGFTHFYDKDVVLAKITPAYFSLTHISF